MHDPFNFAAGEIPAAQESHDLNLTGRGQREELIAGTDNPFNDSVTEGTYFQVLPRLNQLRDRVRAKVGFSACDLIRMLDRIACQANFDPVGAVQDCKTSDAFFRGHEEFNRLEAELARKICSSNVSEVLTLVKDSSYYTPTRRIVTIIEAVYRHMLATSPWEPNAP